MVVLTACQRVESNNTKPDKTSVVIPTEAGRFSVINVMEHRHPRWPNIFTYYVKDNLGSNDFLISISSAGHAMQPVSRTSLER